MGLTKVDLYSLVVRST